MTPERFAALLDAGTTDAPPAPLPTSDLAAGRRRLRSRRATAVGSAVLSVAVLAGVVGLATRGSEDRAVEPVAPPSDSSVLAQCRNDGSDTAALDTLYGSGTPRVRSVAATDRQVVAALESADGTYWAECALAQDDGEFPVSVEVYPSDHSVQARGITELARDYSYGSGCPLVGQSADPDCPTWQLVWVDRLPADVAAVRFDLVDGTSPTVRSEDGYVVLDIVHDRPASVPADEDGTPDVRHPIRRITYLDADGDPIAADGYEEGSPRPVTVDGLPPLSTYPPLRGLALGSQG